jgi:predicted Ser/Thr protein kinase
MDIDRIFSAEQIEVHPDLAGVLKDFTKAAIRANPENLLAFAEQYFRTRLQEASAAAGGAAHDHHASG